MAPQALTAHQIGALAAIDLLNDSLADGIIDRQLTTSIFDANSIIQEAFGVSAREHSTGPHKQRSLVQLYASTEIDRYYNDLPFTSAVLQHPQHCTTNMNSFQLRTDLLLQSPIKFGSDGHHQQLASPFKVPQAKMEINNAIETSPVHRRTTKVDDYATPAETPKRHDSGLELYNLPTQAEEHARKRSRASTPPVSPGHKRLWSNVKAEEGISMEVADTNNRQEARQLKRKASADLSAVCTVDGQRAQKFAPSRRKTVGTLRGGNDTNALAQASPVHAEAQARHSAMPKQFPSDAEDAFANIEKPTKVPVSYLAGRSSTMDLVAKSRLARTPANDFYGNAPPSVRFADKNKEFTKKLKDMSKKNAKPRH